MLSIQGSTRSGFCDGQTRRDFLKIGGLAMGGLSLPDLLRVEASQGSATKHKAVIMVFLPGGPSHQDIFDLKPDAPSEIRGEFKPISTNVAGIQICEQLPRLAQMADKYTLIRSMADCEPGHDAFQCLTGRSAKRQPPGGWPSFGSIVSKIKGSANPAMPPFVGLSPKMGHMEWARNGDPGYLGVSHAPFQPNRGGGTDDMSLNGVSLDRLHDRAGLLEGFDQMRRELDASGLMSGIDSFNEQAIGVLTSPKLLHALDLSREDPRIVSRYGKGENKNRDDGGPRHTDHFLAARRLVEAGARVVTLGFSRWDYHSDNFKQLREDLPLLDSALSALITDLHERGMDKDVAVVVWGEFGRTPIINAKGGRDHWPRVSCAMLAGGNMRHGQVIGSTDKIAAEPADRPVAFGEVFATLYNHLGIDVNKVTLNDHSGRPQYLIEGGHQPLPELV
ncbi:MAG: DUF1501 domain-containing protein [Verrucomicrobiaceae bacterium]|nr:DUF1501 domain-containing protein [Verrucomicrobiaceae bacterium]